MNWMHDFELSKKQTVEETEITKDDKGAEIKTIKKVEKDVPIKFYLQKPTRSLKDAGATYFAVQVSRLVNEDVITRPMLRKKILNVGGILSKQETEDITKLYNDWFEKTNDFTRLSGIEEAKKSEEDKKKLIDLTKELTDIQRRVQEFEQSQASLFDLCAESLGKNRTILWWLIMLAHWDNEKKEQVPFF